MVSLPKVAVLALCVAKGCAQILAPILEFLGGMASQRSPAVDAAAAVLLLPIPMAYLAGVILAYLHVTPAPVARAAPAAPRRFVAITFALVAVAPRRFVAFTFALVAAAPWRFVAITFALVPVALAAFLFLFLAAGSL